MLRRITFRGLAIPSLMLVAACSQSPQSPVSPSIAAGGDTTANPDGSTLKVTAPTPVSPVNGDRIETQRPTFTFNNASGKYSTVPLSYRIQLLDAAGALQGERTVVQSGGGQTSYEADVDLAYESDFQWRVRAELQGEAGPWSALAQFKTPVRPVAGGPFTGQVGPQRSIFFDEALDIIIRIHDELRINLGSRSTREFRIDFLFAAVAAIHYGHPRFNAAGPDPSWCVKDAGGGRPPSDDVLELSRSRDAWDLMGGAGRDGYSFHDDYLGSLPSIQNVYPPPVSALNFFNGR
jgi:hypothetical protein